MHLYHLTLQRPTAVTCSVYGNFSGSKEHELVVARGSYLELLKQDGTGKLQTLLSVNTFSAVRSLVTYRLLGQTTDYLVVGSDSGRLSILEYKKEANEFVKLHVETFGKTGARRITPGQYVAREPSGRALMVAAVEKQKFVYMMDRDAQGLLTISSPLEAHKPNRILFDVVGLDTGVENPIFACLELDYGEVDADASEDAASAANKLLTYYELDLSVKNMIVRWSSVTDRGANALIPVPGGEDGPGGVLVLCENFVLYQHQGQTDLRTAIPRRADMPGRGLLLTAHTVFRSKAGFFALAQSECGDLYKVTLDTADNGKGGKAVTELRVKYFDTVPTASSLAITRNGLLFVACEAGNQCLYSIEALGEDDAAEGTSIKLDAASGAAQQVAVTFASFSPRPLVNLSKVDEAPSLAPITDLTPMVAADPTGGGGGGGGYGTLPSPVPAPQLVTTCGRGPRSTLRVLQQGTHVAEIGRSGMPGAPLAVFSLKAPESVAAGGGGPTQPGVPPPVHPDKYILLSFSNATVAMAVGESIEEVPSKVTGLIDNMPTLAAGVLADGSIVQVTPQFMRRVQYSATGEKAAPANWQTPGRRTIVRAAVNTRQVLIALSGGEIIYFELDGATRQLREAKKIVLPGAEVAALVLPPVPEGLQRAPFAALADSNNMARVLSLDPQRLLEQTSAQALRAGASSLALVTMKVSAPQPQLHLFIGLENGVLTRLVVDSHSGVLSDPRVRYLGVRPVKLVPVTVAGKPAVMALSHRAYVAYNQHGKFALQPLCYDALDSASSLCTEALPEAFVAVAGASLRIFTLDALGPPFYARSLPLEHTPRKMASHFPTGLAVLVESDHNALCAAGRAAQDAEEDGEEGGGQEEMDTGDSGRGGGQGEMEVEGSGCGTSAGGGVAGQRRVGKGDTDGDMAVGDPMGEGVDSRRVPPTPPGRENGAWASSIILVDLNALGAEDGVVVVRHHHSVHARVELEQDEAALSVACVPFHDSGPAMPGMPASAAQALGITPGEQLVLVGVAKGLQFHPQYGVRQAFLHAYRVVPEVVVTDPAGARVEEGAPPPEGSTTVTRYALQLVHKTEMEAVPMVIAPFQGMALVGVGRVLRLYDLGRSQLLRKCEARGLPNSIRTISTSVDRVFVGDAQESVHFIKYKRSENALSVFADDTQPRHMSCTALLDHDTIAGGDKFGNVFVLRLPASVSDDVDSIGPTGSRLLWDSGKLAGAPTKCSMIAQFHVGGAVTSISKAQLTTGGAEVLVYTTVAGAVGCLMPMASKDDADFFTHMELFMRGEESASLTGRDHVSYRSTYGPVSHVIDGDLCEAYGALPAPRQRQVASDLDRAGPHDVLKKLEDVRNRVM